MHMRTTIDLPDKLVEEAMSVSGAKTKRAALCWALEEALRAKAVEDLLARKVKIDFAVTPDELEAWEVEEQYGKARRSRRR